MRVFPSLLIFSLARGGCLIVSAASAGASRDYPLGMRGWPELVGLFEDDRLGWRDRGRGMAVVGEWTWSDGTERVLERSQEGCRWRSGAQTRREKLLRAAQALHANYVLYFVAESL